MNFLRKKLAPVTDAAWSEIQEEATDIFRSVLSARKFVDVTEPQGLDFGAVHTGRIEVASKKKDAVRYGLNKVMPLVEPRVGFSLDIWELDNAARGAEDIDLQPMEEAARKIASFEEQAIYYGLEKAGITGLKNQSDYDSISLPDTTEGLLTALSTQLAKFNRRGIEGPYSLVVSEDDWERLSMQCEGYPLRRQIIQLIKGSIILSSFVDEAYMVTERGGDFRLTLGQDLSVGYNFHDKDSVELYFTESFTFQCFEPAGVMVFAKSD